MHILWTYLRPHSKLALLALLLAAVSQVLAIFQRHGFAAAAEVGEIVAATDDGVRLWVA